MELSKAQAAPEPKPFTLTHRCRVLTAAALFDGHDAAINIMRRILQSAGAEVIHLGHNRSAQDIVTSAIQEDVQAIAISSYQGGHVEFFKYIIDLLRNLKMEHIKVFGGGGGTITPEEISELEKYGVTKIYSPEDGRRLGLQGMIHDMLRKADVSPLKSIDWLSLNQYASQPKALANALTLLEIDNHETHEQEFKNFLHGIQNKKTSPKAKVIGVTGPGGAGKSSLTDELVLRVLEKYPDSRVAVLAIDPTRRKTGGALLGDRLRMNALKNPRAFMRSLATRQTNAAISQASQSAIQLFKAAGFDWIFLETGGIGQADTSIVDIADIKIYVMTSEFGAPTQLEKINMFDYCDMVIINKFDKGGALDALSEVRKQLRRIHRELEKEPLNRYPVFGTIASRFNDEGVNSAFEHLQEIAGEPPHFKPTRKAFDPGNPLLFSIVPKDRTSYLSDISHCLHEYKKEGLNKIEKARRQEAFELLLAQNNLSPSLRKELQNHSDIQHDSALDKQLTDFEKISEKYEADTFSYQVRDGKVEVPLFSESLSHNRIRKVVPPRFVSKSDRLKFLHFENLPGFFPFTAGVFPFKRTEEDPKRQFAGEGTPTRTNKRFHLLCQGEKAKRLSTAFDSVTLYGENPDERPDIYGKIGESGVSICSIDDMKKLYHGFDLCDSNVSVSMTINGPAPILLAFFFNSAIDQQIELFQKQNKRPHTEEEKQKITKDTLRTVRGTVQADILKEDQAQNTCIFSTEFALRMMGDTQQFFVNNDVRNYYSVSISGYHIAEAGANPISQLAFTLANGFTYVEYYLSRGMAVDDFAHNFSFFFSNALDPEYSVIGRVARRIWAVAMKNRYHASERSQKLKYHIQTSGRSLHAHEISFNDIRTTLQALLAYFDSCNSLHTNAYDEAVTTPTEESVRRAMAIQLIISKELGWAKNENPLQGSFYIEELTDLVEEAVLAEFDRLSVRGGVLGAMETQYQRSKIQEESMYYEAKKHTGELPLIGVNTYLNPHENEIGVSKNQLTRASYTEKDEQVKNLRVFHKTHEAEAAPALARLKEVAKRNGNLFEELMHTSRVCSLGQISQALYEIGGQYRRGV